MAANSDDFSVFEQIRATASRRVRLRLGLPSTLRRAIPIEILMVTPVWLALCPWQSSPAWVVVWLRGMSLLISAGALFYFRRMGSRPLEIGWRIFLFGQLLSLLDSVTVERGLLPATIDQLTSAFAAVGGLGLVWGLRLDRVRRATDIERLKSAVAERRNTHRRFVDLVDTVDGVVWEATAEPFAFHFVSRRAGLILGFSPQIWIQNPNLWFERIHLRDRDMVMRQVSENARKLEAYRIEYRMIAADGRTIWVRDLVNVVEGHDGAVKLRGVTVDVTETKQLEHQLRHSAHHDALTGLPNRAAFAESLERAFRNTKRKSTFAVLFLDLDRFKIINDTLGHLAGDNVLQEAAARIVKAVRSRDVVARLGGDEFAVLAENLSEPDEAVQLASRLRAEVNRPVEVSGRKVELSASVGIKLAQPGSGSPRDVLRDADTAMYCAKEAARGSQRIFASEMHDRLVADLEAANEIRSVLDARRLEIGYKPIARLDDGRPFGFEAVLFWRDEAGQQRVVDHCAEIAEQSGLVFTLSWMCLREALLAAACLEGPSTVILAPLPAALLGQADLVDQLEKELRETGARPGRAALAVPEEAIATPDAAALLIALRERGFRIAVSNFGSGRAPLGALCGVPLDFARIARPADRDAAPSGSVPPGPAALLRAMTKLCRDLGAMVIAADVEDEAQARQLAALGCELGQGPLYGELLRAHELDRYQGETVEPVGD